MKAKGRWGPLGIVRRNIERTDTAIADPSTLGCGSGHGEGTGRGSTPVVRFAQIPVIAKRRGERVKSDQKRKFLRVCGPAAIRAKAEIPGFADIADDYAPEAWVMSGHTQVGRSRLRNCPRPRPAGG